MERSVIEQLKSFVKLRPCEIGLVTECQSERSCSSRVDEVDVWLILPTLCEIGELVIAVEVSCVLL